MLIPDMMPGYALLANGMTVHYQPNEHPDFPNRQVSILYRFGVPWEVTCRCAACAKTPSGVGKYVPRWLHERVEPVAEVVAVDAKKPS